MQTSVLSEQKTSESVVLSGKVTAQFAEILTPETLEFVASLHRRFEPRRQELLARRAARQKEFDRAAAEGHARSPRRDHRSDRSQDGDQRAQLRRLDLHGGLRGRELPDLAQ